jgi:hypothetical protein
MALAIFEGEKIYKILYLNAQVKTRDGRTIQLAIRTVLISLPDNNIRIIAQFNVGGVEGIDEREVTLEQGEKLLSNSGEFFRRMNLVPDVFDFTGLVSVESQLHEMRNIEPLKDLADILICRQKWILY